MKTHSTLPQGLYRSRPRPVRLTPAGRVLGVVAIVLCLAAPVVAMLMHFQARADRVERDALLQSGVVTDAVIVRLKRESKENKRASVYYRFDANGRTFESRAKVPIARWRTLDVGGTLPIRYLSANPDSSFADGVEPGVMPAALPFIISPLLLMLGVAGWLSLQSQRRLLTDGRAAIGIIKSVTKSRGQHGETYRRLRYEFPLVSGAVQTGSVQTTKNALDVGSSIAVLYDDENPKRSKPYPLSLVRLAESD